MKITVDIDCTPEEARSFLGLPDVKPMQDELMAEMQERMRASLHAMQPEELFRAWMPANIAGFQAMMDAFQRMAAGKRD
jgi:hypothetical protein